ncbi:uncharacterized protein LOC142157622 isoform X2 [Mixophyes fleayi]
MGVLQTNASTMASDVQPLMNASSDIAISGWSFLRNAMVAQTCLICIVLAVLVLLFIRIHLKDKGKNPTAAEGELQSVIVHKPPDPVTPKTTIERKVCNTDDGIGRESKRSPVKVTDTVKEKVEISIVAENGFKRKFWEKKQQIEETIKLKTKRSGQVKGDKKEEVNEVEETKPT